MFKIQINDTHKSMDYESGSEVSFKSYNLVILIMLSMACAKSPVNRSYKRFHKTFVDKRTSQESI